MASLYKAARQCIAATDIDQKVALTYQAYDALVNGALQLDENEPVEPISEAGRPDKPALVESRNLPRRKIGTREGLAALVHSFVHIEFNAINLAWDAVYRFRGMPQRYYQDWSCIAKEEAYHFSLLRAHLQSFGYDYGSFDAHNGLWEMATETSQDLLIRMAVVPRVLEARGLDVTPSIIRKFRQIGDIKAAEIMEIILHDEIGHVEIGSRWFAWLCEERGLDREQTFEQLVKKHVKERIKGPLHTEARKQAGFNSTEMALLEAMAENNG